MSPADSPDPELLGRIKAALRRDLKLDADEPIPDDMPLVGAGAEVDSIDVLLIVGTLEQEFGVRVPDSDVGEQVFATVATLAAYVQSHRDAPREPAGVAEVPVDWRERLPHGPEFRYVSDVTSLRPGESCRGLWRVAGDEPFLRGHFPGNPLVPGVLIVEALAQVAGLACGDREGGGGVLAQVDVKFSSPVPPPAELALEARVRGTAGSLRLCDVTATRDGSVVAQGTVALSLTTSDARRG